MNRDKLNGLGIVLLFATAVFGTFIPAILRGLALGIAVAVLWQRSERS